MKAFHCDYCGLNKPTKQSGGTGYATTDQDHLHCFACCGESDREHMETHDRMTLYLVDGQPGVHPTYNQYRVTNWPGTLSFQVYPVRHGRHNIAGSRIDVWFVDHTGRRWWGVQYGEWTQICHCRKLKEVQAC